MQPRKIRGHSPGGGGSSGGDYDNCMCSNPGLDSSMVGTNDGSAGDGGATATGL